MPDTNAYAALRAKRAREHSAAQKKAFARLTGAQILAGLSEEQKVALAAKLGVKSAPAAAKSTGAKAAPAKAAKAGPSYGDGLGKGFIAGRDVERARIREVTAVALERGQAADALKMLATDADAPTIIAKLKETNLLVEAAKARYGSAAR